MEENKKITPMKFSNKQKKEIIAQIEKLRSEGASITVATKELGIGPSRYYRWIHKKPRSKQNSIEQMPSRHCVNGFGSNLNLDDSLYCADKDLDAASLGQRLKQSNEETKKLKHIVAAFVDLFDLKIKTD